MKPTHLLPLVPAITNRWAFYAFLIALAVSLYRSRRDDP